MATLISIMLSTRSRTDSCCAGPLRVAAELATVTAADPVTVTAAELATLVTPVMLVDDGACVVLGHDDAGTGIVVGGRILVLGSFSSSAVSVAEES